MQRAKRAIEAGGGNKCPPAAVDSCIEGKVGATACSSLTMTEGLTGLSLARGLASRETLAIGRERTFIWSLLA